MPSQHISTAVALGRSSSLFEWLWMAFPICSQLLFFPILVQVCYRNQADLLAQDLQRLSQAGLVLGGKSLAAILQHWAHKGYLTPITKSSNKLFEINTETIFGGCERPGLSTPRIFKQSCDLNNHHIFLLARSKSSKVGQCNCRRRLTPAWTADLLLLLKPPITSTLLKSTDKIHTQILPTWKRYRSVFSYLRVISFSWFKVTWTTCSHLFI